MSGGDVLSFSFRGASSVATESCVRSGQIDGIVTGSAALSDALERVRRVAPTDTTVLITGETGTGKELIARAIHRQSRRSGRALVAAHLAAVPNALIASELFGHERGAFTGADRPRTGRFELADRGTLFLDEIGELGADLQVALLRGLQEGEFERVGSSETRRVNVRVIAATNRNLAGAVAQGCFRTDLFYRLNVFPIHLPPLRDRPEDVPALATHFLAQMESSVGRQFARIEPASMKRLREYAWPGNVRELQNVIERAAILSDGEELRIPPDVIGHSQPPAAPQVRVEPLFEGTPTLEELKKSYILHLLSTHGNMSRVARLLDVDRRSLYRMIERYDITRE